MEFEIEQKLDRLLEGRSKSATFTSKERESVRKIQKRFYAKRRDLCSRESVAYEALNGIRTKIFPDKGGFVLKLYYS